LNDKSSGAGAVTGSRKIDGLISSADDIDWPMRIMALFNTNEEPVYGIIRSTAVFPAENSASSWAIAGVIKMYL
jgi:hypothetical protein